MQSILYFQVETYTPGNFVAFIIAHGGNFYQLLSNYRDLRYDVTYIGDGIRSDGRFNSFMFDEISK